MMNDGMCDPMAYHDSDWSNPISSSSSSAQKECTICGAPSNGYHFNAPSCSACAAFFRRTVTLNRNFQCSHQNNCRVNYAMRVICRCCRYQKCIRVGMERAAVQPRRDCNAGRRKILYHQSNSHHQTPPPTSSSSSSTIIPTDMKPLPYSHQPKDELVVPYDYTTPTSSSPDVHYAQSYSSSISEDVPSPKTSLCSSNALFSL